MKPALQLGLLTILASLAGCATMTQEQTRKTARKVCAEDGLVFLETGTVNEGGMFGVAGVKGECVPADDPRLAQPQPQPQKTSQPTSAGAPG